MVPMGYILNMEELVGMLGYERSSLPLTYLGLLLGAKFKATTIWNPNLEKMEKRLVDWKRLLSLMVLSLIYKLIFFLYFISWLGWLSS